MLCLSFDWLMGKAPRDLSQYVIGCLSCDVIALFKFKVTFRFSRSTQILGKFPVSINGFYPLRSTSNFASFPSFLTASYSCVILPFFYVVISCFSILGTARLLQVPAAVDA